MSLSLLNFALKVILIVLCGAFVLVSSGLIMFPLLKGKKPTISRYLYFFIISCLQVLVVETVNEKSRIQFGSTICTVLFMFCLNFIFGAWHKKFKISTFVITLFFYIYAVINNYVIIFRRDPISVTDIKAAKTALAVAGNYDFTPPASMIYGTIILLLTSLVIFSMKVVDAKLKYWPIFICLFIGLLFTRLYYDKNDFETVFNVSQWDKADAVKRNGMILDFYLAYVYSKFDYPEGYNEESFKEVLDNVENVVSNNDTEAINVICILSESLYDLERTENLELNADPLEYWHSLKNNTIKGYTTVSTFGGGTSNSEFEFLTGRSLAFMPVNTFPFNHYINQDTTSIATNFKNNGFKTISFHPFLKTSWERDEVYPRLGFDNYIAEVDLDESVTSNKDNYLRDVFSDMADVKQIENIYENKQDGEKLFLYNVTIQNHASFERTEGVDTIHSNKYKDNEILDTYLSLVDKTDDSIKELIEYFDKIDEPTVICIFGDHIPGTVSSTIGTSVIDSTNYDVINKYYTTPFIIHTNFDIDEKEYEEPISLPYLSSLVLDYSGIDKMNEFKLSSKYMNDYPVICAYGYKKDGVWYNREEMIIDDDLRKFRDLTYYQLTSK